MKFGESRCMTCGKIFNYLQPAVLKFNGFACCDKHFIMMLEDEVKKGWRTKTVNPNGSVDYSEMKA